MYKSLAVSMLRSGAKLSSPVFDEQGTKLLDPGAAITQELLRRLQQRGVQEVRVDGKDLARLCAFEPQGTSKSVPPDRGNTHVPLRPEVRRQFDAQAEEGLGTAMEPRGERFLNGTEGHRVTRYDQEDLHRFVETHEACVSQVDDLFGSLVAGSSGSLGAIESVPSDVLRRATEDLDLLVCLGIHAASDSYPSRHSLHVATLAMAIAATLGWDEAALTELGLGCLVHDVGMLRIRPEVYQSGRVLGASEVADVAMHSVHTFELLQDNLEGAPLVARLVACQMHERCNGSGYPRERTGDQIHELAKIAMVADTFIALTSQRPHRAGMLPYYAMEKVLYGVRDGLYDSKVVRALLERVSLFPVGSYVAMSDGRVGKVIRPGKEQYDRPIVDVWDPRAAVSTAEVVDLGQAQELRIVEPLASVDVTTAGAR